MNGTEDNEDKNDGPKSRNTFLYWQRVELKRIYQTCMYPDKAKYKSIAQKLNLEERQVYKWFQNYRYQSRKLGSLDPVNPKMNVEKDDESDNKKGKRLDEDTKVPVPKLTLQKIGGKWTCTPVNEVI